MRSLQLVLADDDAPDVGSSSTAVNASRASTHETPAGAAHDAPTGELGRARVPGGDREHPLDLGRDGGRRRPSQPRTARRASTGGSAASARRASARRHRARPRAASSSRNSDSCAQHVGLAREHRDEVAPGDRRTSSGSTSWRTATRRNARIVRSSGRRAPARPERVAQRARSRPGAAPSSGRATVPRPRGHAREPGRRGCPRSRLSSTVSAWSSAVWPTSTHVGARRSTARRSSASYARVARARLEVAARLDAHRRAPRNPAPSARRRARDRRRPRASLPARRPWSTCTATGASPASRASASNASESAPPEHATTTGAVDARRTSKRAAPRHGASGVHGAGGGRRQAPSTRPSQSAGRAARRASAATRARATRRRSRAGPASRSTAATNASPTSYWRIFDSRPTSLCSTAVMPVALAARLQDTRHARLPDTCSRPSRFITRLPWPSSSDISACTLRQRAALLRRWRAARRGRRRRAGCGRRASRRPRARAPARGGAGRDRSTTATRRPATGSRACIHGTPVNCARCVHLVDRDPRAGSRAGRNAKRFSSARMLPPT